MAEAMELDLKRRVSWAGNHHGWFSEDSLRTLEATEKGEEPSAVLGTYLFIFLPGRQNSKMGIKAQAPG